jgi:abortive infection bacteriophage resistance protein
MRYIKPALSFDQQVYLLKLRGLVVDDPADAAATLSRISYYRLSAYFKPFIPASGDNFAAGTTFEEILALYRFDKDLRSLISDPLECVEVYFRTRITCSDVQLAGMQVPKAWKILSPWNQIAK